MEAEGETPKPKPSAVEIQQEYYEAVGGSDWELYEKKDRKYLLQKIAVALYGPPTKEGNLVSKSDYPSDGKSTQKVLKDDELKLQGYELRDEEGAMNVFNKICEQEKYSYNGENILISVLRVVCVVPKDEVPFFKVTPKDYWVNLHDKSGDVVHTWIFHVFSIRQCISMKPEGKGCRIFIDHDARVYKNWDDYLTENTLPKSVVVVPENGEYRGTYGTNFDLGDLSNVMPSVKLSVVPSPALGVGATVLKVTDNISAVANIGALVGIVGAFAAPAIAPVALGTALGVGVITGTYAIVRSSINLADRGKHEQSISLADSEARGCWINILVSTAGISCSAAGKLLSWAATSGTNVKILMNAVQVLQYTNLTTGVLGVANGLGDMIYKYNKYDETPSGLEVFQLTTSLLFLGIGAMSNQTAQEIVQDAQANKINEVRDSLSSNVKKKMFDKITAETRRVEGTIKGNADIISALKKIDNKDDFFGNIAKINKNLNKNKLRISLSSDGNPLINNQHNIDVAKLQALGKGGRDQFFAKYDPAKITTKNAPTRLYASNSSANAPTFPQYAVCPIGVAEMYKITDLIINLSKIDQEFIAELLSDLSANLHDAFLLLCAELIASFTPGESAFLSDRHHKVRTILFVFDYLKSQINVNSSDTNISFANVLKRYIRDGRISKETILQLKNKLYETMNRKKSFFDDHRRFDDLYNKNKNYDRTLLTLQAGDVIKVGLHNILIKNRTIEKIDAWFELFFLTQKKSDLFLNLCFEVIASLKTSEILKLNEINPDDDVIVHVSYFLIFVADGILEYLIDDCMFAEFLTDITINIKLNLMEWRNTMVLRPYDVCNVCEGVRYKN